MNQAFLTASDR